MVRADSVDTAESRVDFVGACWNADAAMMPKVDYRCGFVGSEILWSRQVRSPEESTVRCEMKGVIEFLSSS